jgi:hypothetical protein
LTAGCSGRGVEDILGDDDGATDGGTDGESPTPTRTPVPVSVGGFEQVDDWFKHPVETEEVRNDTYRGRINVENLDSIEVEKVALDNGSTVVEAGYSVGENGLEVEVPKHKVGDGTQIVRLEYTDQSGNTETVELETEVGQRAHVTDIRDEPGTLGWTNYESERELDQVVNDITEERLEELHRDDQELDDHKNMNYDWVVERAKEIYDDLESEWENTELDKVDKAWYATLEAMRDHKRDTGALIRTQGNKPVGIRKFMEEKFGWNVHPDVEDFLAYQKGETDQPPATAFPVYRGVKSGDQKVHMVAHPEDDGGYQIQQFSFNQTRDKEEIKPPGRDFENSDTRKHEDFWDDLETHDKRKTKEGFSGDPAQNSSIAYGIGNLIQGKSPDSFMDERWGFVTADYAKAFEDGSTVEDGEEMARLYHEAMKIVLMEDIDGEDPVIDTGIDSGESDLNDPDGNATFEIESFMMAGDRSGDSVVVDGLSQEQYDRWSEGNYDTVRELLYEGMPEDEIPDDLNTELENIPDTRVGTPLA